MDSVELTEIGFNYKNHHIQVFNIAGEHSDKPFVFINGIASPVQNHLDILSGLADNGFNVWAINMPGHGDSAQLENVSWDLMVDIVNELISTYGLENLTLGGFSMGGGIALRYAEKYPDKVKELRLLSPLCYDLPSLPGLIMDGVLFSLNFVKNRLANLQKEPPVKIYPIYYATHYQGIYFQSELDITKLGGVKVHVVLGEDDPIIEAEKVVAALQGIPGIDFKIIGNLTHDIYFIPETLTSEIVESMVK